MKKYSTMPFVRPLLCSKPNKLASAYDEGCDFQMTVRDDEGRRASVKDHDMEAPDRTE